MGAFHRVCSIEDLPSGERTTVWLSGTNILVLNVGGEILAVDEQCTHMQCSLVEGPLKGTIIGCPCHLAAFDLRDGRVLFGPAKVPLPVHKVQVEDGEILVEVPPLEIV
jgi:3-phenylpropionate/trans-cinnamate dioxygenase ferredoxin component